MSAAFFKAYRILLFVIIVVIGLGGATRAMNAGLSCPDWPLCFGKFIPDYHPQVYFEFIHRALAGSMGLFSLVMSYLIFKNNKISRSLKYLCGFAFVVYITQAIFGALTVTRLLEPGMVATHLVLGITFLALHQWVYLSLQRSADSSKKKSTPAPRWIIFAGATVLLTIILQIILGGKVASNYAGLACSVDFPLCFGKLAPTFHGTVGLHVMHRLGAYITFLAVVALFLALNFTKQRAGHPRLVKISRMLITLVLVQIALGIANIKFFLPALLTVLHTIMAAGIVATVVFMVYLAINGETHSKSC